jgi:glyoxylase-like metal-dependent hydrolase (beta-lactamase superfamily II)
MGGLESQWVCHSHDLIRGSLHQDLHDRFGCPLHYHKIDRPRVRKKTKCPSVEFEGDGTQHGSDFEALFLPTCTAGHSIYRWRSRGKYFLFTSHAIYQRDSAWNLQFNQSHIADWSQLATLAKFRVDYVFPGYTAVDEADFYRLDDRARKSFSRALRAKLKQAA